MSMQQVLSLVFTGLFLVWMGGSAWLLWLIWRAMLSLIGMMSDTILRNARENVDIIHRLAVKQEVPPEPNES